MPRAGERRAKADQPLLGRIPARGAGDRADPAVAELEQVLGRLLCARRVHRRDARDARPAAARAGRRRRMGSLRAAASRSSSSDSSGSIRIAPSVVPRIRRSSIDTSRSCSCSVGREDDAHVALVERLGGAAQHRAEVGVGDERQSQPDHAGSAAREPARPTVPAEAVLADDLQHPLAGVRERHRAGRSGRARRSRSRRRPGRRCRESSPGPGRGARGWMSACAMCAIQASRKRFRQFPEKMFGLHGRRSYA